MTHVVETSTPPGTPTPIGPYHHIAKVGPFVSIGGTAGVDPRTGRLAGEDIYAQAKQILQSLNVMLESVGSDLQHVVHEAVKCALRVVPPFVVAYRQPCRNTREDLVILDAAGKLFLERGPHVGQTRRATDADHAIDSLRRNA